MHLIQYANTPSLTPIRGQLACFSWNYYEKQNL